MTDQGFERAATRRAMADHDAREAIDHDACQAMIDRLFPPLNAHVHLWVGCNACRLAYCVRCGGHADDPSRPYERLTTHAVHASISDGYQPSVLHPSPEGEGE